MIRRRIFGFFLINFIRFHPILSSFIQFYLISFYFITFLSILLQWIFLEHIRRSGDCENDRK